MKQSIASVNIPDRYLRLASRWHSGQGDLLYAVSSTGGLTLGSQRPFDRDANRSLTDREWHVSLWSGLSSDIYAAVRSASGRDKQRLERFERYADRVTDRLRTIYGLENSDVV
jgi:hypothetical protein